MRGIDKLKVARELEVMFRNIAADYFEVAYDRTRYRRSFIKLAEGYCPLGIYLFADIDPQTWRISGRVSGPVAAAARDPKVWGLLKAKVRQNLAIRHNLEVTFSLHNARRAFVWVLENIEAVTHIPDWMERPSWAEQIIGRQLDYYLWEREASERNARLYGAASNG
jgi:hypothetical protein